MDFLGFFIPENARQLITPPTMSPRPVVSDEEHRQVHDGE